MSASRPGLTISRRGFLGAAAGLAATTLPGCPHDDPPETPPRPSAGAAAGPALATPTAPTSDPTLRAKAAARGLIYGAMVEGPWLRQDPELVTATVRECQLVVPGLSLKWAACRPSPGEFNFTKSDFMFQFTRQNSLLFRGHTLVWHTALPPWLKDVATSANAESLLVQHIQTVVGRYAGGVHSWDVVNEALEPQGGRPDRLRMTPWLRLLGPTHLDLAFYTAAQADPKALLFYNDYGFELEGTGAKRDAALTLLQGMRQRGVPVQALGVQGHIGGPGWPSFSPNAFRAFLADVGRLGLPIYITELDCKDLDLPADPALRDAQVAQRYADYLAVALDEPAVRGVITWGISDKYSWIAREHPRPDGLPTRPLPLDEAYQRKAAWTAMGQAFDAARPRPPMG